MWEAFHGRSAAYAAAMSAGDVDALDAALERNVWRGEPVPAGSAGALRRVVLAQDAHLSAQGLSDLARGVVYFLSAEAAGQ